MSRARFRIPEDRESPHLLALSATLDSVFGISTDAKGAYGPLVSIFCPKEDGQAPNGYGITREESVPGKDGCYLTLIVSDRAVLEKLPWKLVGKIEDD